MKSLLITASIALLMVTPVYASDDRYDDYKKVKYVKGDTGPQGLPGKDGRDGKDGVSFDYDRYMKDLAGAAALGGLELRTPTEGIWTYGLGLGGTSSAGESAEAISAGIRYGVSESSSVYGKISRPLSGDSTSWYVGFEGQF